MAYDFYYYNTAVEHNNFEDFKSCDYKYHPRHKDDKFFDLEYYDKEFKGFNYNHEYGYTRWNGSEWYDYKADLGLLGELEKWISYQVLQFTRPVYDSKTGLIEYYSDLDKRRREIKTKAKLGKFLRKVAPYYNDKQIEFLVNITKEMCTIPEVTFFESQDREDFARIYTSKPRSGSRISDEFSCINASCMRHTYGDVHPSEIYASGDFKIMWVEDENNRVAARVIYCTLDGTHAYIYASSTRHGNALKEKMLENGYELKPAEDVEYAWEGAKLLKIDNDDYNIVSVYLDVCQYVKDEDDHLIITDKNYDYCFNETGGYTYKICTCAECGSKVSTYNTTEIDSKNYCGDCASYCDFTDKPFVGERVRVVIDVKLQGDYFYNKGDFSFSITSEEYAQENLVWNDREDYYFTKEAQEKYLQLKAQEAA